MVERDGDHVDAVVFANFEVPVVAGHGAKKRDRLLVLLLCPRFRAVAGSFEKRIDNYVMHQREA